MQPITRGLLTVLAAVTASAQTVELFEAPNSYFTVATANNDRGDIVGYFQEVDSLIRAGFVRDHSGSTTVFYIPDSRDVVPREISPAGEIVGYYLDAATNISRGFLRNREGILTTIAVPGASVVVANGINPSGEVTGAALIDGFWHGFVRSPSGTVSLLGIPHAFSTAINPGATVTGFLATDHTAFVRDSSATVTYFQAPGAERTLPVALNANGEVTGWFATYPGGPSQGFLRSRAGQFELFGPPGFSYTEPQRINSAGDIVGWSFQLPANQRAFLRTRNGALTLLDIPNSSGSAANGINNSGTVVGWTNDLALNKLVAFAMRP
ncbi:MAG: hypothetical protein JNN08_32700 [Bryobacterales bacterium]|nr:hypothetical protein [Bryobacterales bacterium]